MLPPPPRVYLIRVNYKSYRITLYVQSLYDMVYMFYCVIVPYDLLLYREHDAI